METLTTEERRARTKAAARELAPALYGVVVHRNIPFGSTPPGYVRPIVSLEGERDDHAREARRWRRVRTLVSAVLVLLVASYPVGVLSFPFLLALLFPVASVSVYYAENARALDVEIRERELEEALGASR